MPRIRRDINLPEGSQSASFCLCASLHLERQDDHLVPGHGRAVVQQRSRRTVRTGASGSPTITTRARPASRRTLADRLVAQTVTPSTIETTGHSLGGALAGFVAEPLRAQGDPVRQHRLRRSREPAPHGNGDNGRGDGRAPGGSRILFRQHRDVLDVRAWVDLTKDPVTQDLEARTPVDTGVPEGSNSVAHYPAGQTRFRRRSNSDFHTNWR